MASRSRSTAATRASDRLGRRRALFALVELTAAAESLKSQAQDLVKAIRVFNLDESATFA